MFPLIKYRMSGRTLDGHCADGAPITRGKSRYWTNRLDQVTSETAEAVAPFKDSGLDV